MNKEFLERTKLYFGDKADEFINKLNEPCTHGFFLNTNKSSKEEILKLIDFDYEESNLNPNSYVHNNESIGKTKAYELGLIYPQDTESSLFTNFLNYNPKLIVDLCAAPGGKSINIANKFKAALLISNDVSYKRTSALASNLERCGIDNVIVTSKKPQELTNLLKGCADLVILDAPCSGEGMIRKYPEILDTYDVNNILSLANTQKELLEYAYELLNEDGILVYSTCTYALEEDENQIEELLNAHSDMQLISINNKNNYSKLSGTIKLCPLNNTEGQFISILQRKSENETIKPKYLNTIKNKLVDTFIRENINIDNYYLYKNNDNYYLSFTPLYNLKNNVIRYGIYLGEVIKDRFEPNHNLYRANSLIGKFKFVYDLNDEEYEKFIKGYELKVNLNNNYYLITYKNLSLGFGKASNGILKNKYPKGIRRL